MQLTDNGHCELVSDETLSRGEYRLQTDTTELDGTISEKVAILAEQIFQDNKVENDES